MDSHKKIIIEELQKIVNEGYEGAIPMLIKECVSSLEYKHNTKRIMLYWTARHCDNK